MSSPTAPSSSTGPERTPQRETRAAAPRRQEGEGFGTDGKSGTMFQWTMIGTYLSKIGTFLSQIGTYLSQIGNCEKDQTLKDHLWKLMRLKFLKLIYIYVYIRFSRNFTPFETYIPFKSFLNIYTLNTDTFVTSFDNLKQNPRMKMKPTKQGGCCKEFEQWLIPGLKAVEVSDPAIPVTTVSVHVSKSLNRFRQLHHIIHNKYYYAFTHLMCFAVQSHVHSRMIDDINSESYLSYADISHL